MANVTLKAIKVSPKRVRHSRMCSPSMQHHQLPYSSSSVEYVVLRVYVDTCQPAVENLLLTNVALLPTTSQSGRSTQARSQDLVSRGANICSGGGP